MDMPELTFQSDWKVTIYPPGEAAVRFTVRKDTKHVSVFLDENQTFSLEPSPYWEVWKGSGGVKRVAKDDVTGLMVLIRRYLK